MPWLWANIAGLLVGLAGSLVGRVLVALGIGATSYTGITLALGAIRGYVTGAQPLIGQYWWIVDMLQIGHALEIIISAVTFKFVMAGASPNGVLWRWTYKTPSVQGKLF